MAYKIDIGQTLVFPGSGQSGKVVYAIKGSSSTKFYTYLNVTLNSQDQINKTSNVTISMSAQAWDTNGFTGENSNDNVSTILVNGSSVKTGYVSRIYPIKTICEWLSWTGDLKHNEDGTLVFRVSATHRNNSSAASIAIANYSFNTYEIELPSLNLMYTVTFNPNGGYVEPSSKVVTNGETYGELPIPEFQGLSFIGWFTEDSGGSRILESTVVDLKQDQTLYARWGSSSNARIFVNGQYTKADAIVFKNGKWTRASSYIEDNGWHVSK